MKKKLFKIRPISKLIIYITVFLVFCGIISFICYDVILKMKSDKNTFVMNYTDDTSLTYKVCLHDNPYYLQECMDMDKVYPHSIINKIKYNISNHLKASKNMQVTYTYQVVANLISETKLRNNLQNELWNKEFILVPKTSKTITSNRIDIDQDFEIDYNYYEKLMEDYKHTFPVEMEAYLKIEYRLNLDNDKENIHEKQSLNSYIPMLKPIVKIKNSDPREVNRNIYADKSNIFNYSYLFVITSFLSIINILILIRCSRINIAVNLEAKVNKLLKLYEQSIIIVSELPSKNGLEVVDIKKFSDLIDLEQSLKIPIMFLNKSDELKVFAIFSDKYIYRLIITRRNVGIVI
ncbi:MAG: DUF5305 family protein [Bacilli bacterium]